MFKKNGFTLLEILIVIAIIGILSGFVTIQVTSSIGKSYDSRRKSDLNAIQKALESYYNDNNAYPSSLTFGGALCATAGCSSANYMKPLPNDPHTCSYAYIVGSNNQSYQLYSTLGNSADIGTGIVQTGYTIPSCGSCICKYGVSSSNTTP
ncbi:MAG: type II secretion system protein GspG [Candidatus Roizmanbacteria bacterium]